MRWFILIFFYVVLSLYVLQGVKTARHPWLYYGYIMLAGLVLVNVVYQFTSSAVGSIGISGAKGYAIGFVLAMLAFNLVVVFLLLSEDLVRVVAAVYHKFFGSSEVFMVRQRRQFLSKLALGLAAIPLGAILYGMYRGKYNYKVLTYEIEYPDLPKAFDGYTITQISDIHSGSLDDADKLAYAITLINKQNSDVILFTGDMVNNTADEMKPWAGLFGSLEAKDGKFSVLGNHDYGDYVSWPSGALKAKNLQDLKDLQAAMGFDLLLNEHRYLQRGADKIALVGVENWGRGGFKKAGDLDKATAGLKNSDFKVLMSHDPSHWEDIVVPAATHYHLTLSGHTHGMQFGIEIPGWVKWSPIKWRYKYWAGLYEENKQFINVNRGFGVLGYPGRVGIWPEITVITLKKKASTTV